MVRLQCLLLALYLMVLPVLILNNIITVNWLNMVLVISPDPLRDGTVLLHLLCKLALDAEGLQSGHGRISRDFWSEKS